MPDGQHIKHAKLRDEWAELRFQLRAMEQGLILARPRGDCAPYGFLVARPEKATATEWVKCTLYKRDNSY